MLKYFILPAFIFGPGFSTILNGTAAEPGYLGVATYNLILAEGSIGLARDLHESGFADVSRGNSEFLMLSALIVGAGMLGGVIYTTSNRIAGRRSMRLMSSFPGGVCVCTHGGKILFYRSEIGECWKADSAGLFRLLAPLDGTFADIKGVFKSGEERSIENNAGILRIIPLERGLFGIKTVACFWRRNENIGTNEISKKYAGITERFEEYVKSIRRVLDYLPMHIFTKDADDEFKYVFVNSGMRSFVPKEVGEIAGKTDFEIFSDCTAKELRKSDEMRIIGEEYGVNGVFEIADCNGKLHYMKSMNCGIIRGNNGHRLIVGARIDITDIVNAKKELSYHKESWKNSLKNVSDGIIVVDDMGRIMDMNSAAESFCGMPFEEAVGKVHTDCLNVVNNVDGNSVPSPVWNSLRDGKDISLNRNIDIILPNGERRHISDASSPIRDTEGNIVGAVLSIKDITKECREREMAIRNVRLLDTVSETLNAAYFFYDLKSGETDALEAFYRIWPKGGDGCAIPYSEFVHRDDLAMFENKFQKLIDGVSDMEEFVFRSGIEGENRYYNLSLRSNISPSYESKIAGIIQDITHDKENELELKDYAGLLNAVMDKIPIIVFTKKPHVNFSFDFINRHFEEFVGCPGYDIVGKTDFDLFDDSRAEKTRRIDAIVLNSDKPLEFSEERRDHEGKRHKLHTTKTKFNAANGETLLLGMSLDITELKKRLGENEWKEN